MKTTALQLWNKAVAIYESRGLTHSAAVREVATKHDELHAVMLMEQDMKQNAAHEKHLAGIQSRAKKYRKLNRAKGKK